MTALRAAGGAPEHLVQVTIYIVDVPAYRARAGEIGAVWRRLCGRDYPAVAGIGVAGLWDDEALVEIAGRRSCPPVCAGSASGVDDSGLRVLLVIRDRRWRQHG